MNRVTATELHARFYQDLVALLQKYDAGMNLEEMLAIAANMVGKLIALQDQRTMTPARALEIVRRNIEEGNQQTMDSLLNAATGEPS